MPDYTESREKSKDSKEKEPTKKKLNEKLLSDLSLLGLLNLVPALLSIPRIFHEDYQARLGSASGASDGNHQVPWGDVLAGATAKGILGGLLNTAITGLILLLFRAARKKNFTKMLEDIGIEDLQRQKELIEEYETKLSKVRLRRALTGAAIGAPIGALGIAAARSEGILPREESALVQYSTGIGEGAVAGSMLALLYHLFKGIK